MALLVGPWCDDPDRLALNVGHFASVVKGHMSGLPIGITCGLGQRLRMKVILNDLALVRRLWGEEIPGNLLGQGSVAGFTGS